MDKQYLVGVDIGGTKCGALFGEAVVVPDPALLPHFFTVMKQQGALLAKGRLLGLQFDALFTDDLYQQIGETALRAAQAMRAAFRKAGFDLSLDSPTNQVFVVLETALLPRLAERVGFTVWERLDESHTLVRFAASWATTAEDVAKLEAILKG